MNSCAFPLTACLMDAASLAWWKQNWDNNRRRFWRALSPWVIRLICSIKLLKCRRSFSVCFKSSGGCRWSVLITVPFMADHICLSPISDPPHTVNAYCIQKKKLTTQSIFGGDEQKSRNIWIATVCASPIVSPALCARVCLRRCSGSWCWGFGITSRTK